VNRPTRATADGRVYLDLQNLARRQGRPTGELHQLYALEGFLARLARSRFLDHLILKGGALLAAYEIRRPTRDIDLEGATFPVTPHTWWRSSGRSRTFHWTMVC